MPDKPEPVSGLQKGCLMLDLGKYAEAEHELRRHLASFPDEGAAHASLALALAQLDRIGEALAEARLAVHNEPESAFCHYVLARCHIRDNNEDSAEKSLKEALRLNPQDADYLHLLAAVYCDKSDYKAALETSEKALAIDPESADFLNLHSKILTMLGRDAEAARDAALALAKEADSCDSHTSLGLSLLSRGEHLEAMKAFREALRLDPDSETARRGMLSALKSEYRFYRWLLSYFFWVSRFSPNQRAALWFGAYFVVRLFPPLAVIYLPFLYSTWVGEHLANFFISFNKFGETALTEDEKTAGLVIGGLSCLAPALLAGGLLFPPLFIPALGLLLLTLPLCVCFRARPGLPRRLLFVYTALVLLCGIFAAGAYLSGLPGDSKAGFAVLYLLGCIIASWFPHIGPLKIWFDE